MLENQIDSLSVTESLRSKKNQIYSLCPKIIATIEFKICPTKIANLTYLPQKARQFLEDSHKKQLKHYPLIIKDKVHFGNFTPSIGLLAWF